MPLNAEQRTLIRASRDRRVRLIVTETDRMFGSPFCQQCYVDIEPKPGKRFCSDRCRKRHGDTHTAQGRKARHARKRRAERRQLDQAA